MIRENIWGLSEAILPSKTGSVLIKKTHYICKLFNLCGDSITCTFGCIYKQKCSSS